MDSMYVPRPSRLWKNKTDFFRPFRAAANDRRLDGLSQSSDSLTNPREAVQDDEEELKDLNNALHTLVEVFPGIEAATFRDMLSKLSPESRLEVVTEQVLRRRGGVTIGSKTGNTDQGQNVQNVERHRPSRAYPLQTEETFRGERYNNAVRNLFYQEFKSLNHSTIRAVMAENNGSYSRARPVLQQLATRTWRFSISNLWSRKTVTTQSMDHPALLWEAKDATNSDLVPVVKESGSPQLDDELRDLFVTPVREKLDQERAAADQQLARQLNTEDAERFGATYDCECCYATVTFEDIATCGSGEHFLCHDCISRSTSEALYGQGWARTVDLDKATIRCFAPSIKECQASLPSDALRRALVQDFSKPHVWQEFQDRVSSESLLKSSVPLERCPNCTYAEVNEVPAIRSRDTTETISLCRKSFRRHMHPTLSDGLSCLAGSTIVMLETIVITILLPLWFLASGLHLISIYVFDQHKVGTTRQRFGFNSILTRAFGSSVKRVYSRRRGPKFHCRSPSCGTVSCTRCRGIWHDPHICFEDEKTSLRTTIEASATAVVKRTCPKCMLR